MVDSSGYGPVTITKSISLIAPRGIHAGISPSSGDAVEVNAGTSGKVVLRTLSLNGANGGRNGVDYNSASSLVVEDCGVANFANHGIERLAKSPDLAQLTVSDTVLRGNGAREGEGGALIARNAGSGSTDVDIDHSRAQLNLSGFEIGDGAKATSPTASLPAMGPVSWCSATSRRRGCSWSATRPPATTSHRHVGWPGGGVQLHHRRQHHWTCR